MALKLFKIGYFQQDRDSFSNVEIKIKRQKCFIRFSKPDSWVDFRSNQNKEPQFLAVSSYFIADTKYMEMRLDGSFTCSQAVEINLIKSKGNKKERDLFSKAVSNFNEQQREVFYNLVLYRFYLYRNNLYLFDSSDIHNPPEQQLLIKEHYYKQEKKFAKLRKEIKLLEKLESMEVYESREPIPEDVRFAVWRRDEGKCVKCGIKNNLEFDHIIPVSKGGSNTERNIQILCEKCNREKSDKI